MPGGGCGGVPGGDFGCCGPPPPSIGVPSAFQYAASVCEQGRPSHFLNWRVRPQAYCDQGHSHCHWVSTWELGSSRENSTLYSPWSPITCACTNSGRL